MNNVNIVYTPWANLKKTADMDVGQIGFHRQKDVSIIFLPDLSKGFKLLSCIRPRSEWETSIITCKMLKEYVGKQKHLWLLSPLKLKLV